MPEMLSQHRCHPALVPPMTNLPSNSFTTSNAVGPIQGLDQPLAESGTSGGDNTGELAALAHRLLEDPIALHQLSDRVFELLQQDIRLQQERHRTYRRT